MLVTPPQDKQLAGQSIRQTLEAVCKNGYSFMSYDIGWSMPDWLVDTGDVHNKLAKIPQHIPSCTTCHTERAEIMNIRRQVRRSPLARKPIIVIITELPCNINRYRVDL